MLLALFVSFCSWSVWLHLQSSLLFSYILFLADFIMCVLTNNSSCAVYSVGSVGLMFS